jgi:acyl-coenzyme A thioesterase PaaI-like protein
MKSLQERYAPNSFCFGCGPKNPKGLRIRSFAVGHEVVADWKPQPQHVAFAGFVNGGILSTLLDCNGNWTAAYTLMRRDRTDSPPGTVTSGYEVKFLRPTPVSKTMRIRARALSTVRDHVTIEGSIEVDGKTTASMKGTFVAVKEGHPAFHRWE